MAQLAQRHGHGPASLTEIAEQEDLPRAYLEQLVNQPPRRRAGAQAPAARTAATNSPAARADSDGEVLRRPRGADRADDLRERRAQPQHLCSTGYCTVNFMWFRVRDAIAGRPRFDDPGRSRTIAGAVAGCGPAGLAAPRRPAGEPRPHPLVESHWRPTGPPPSPPPPQLRTQGAPAPT